MEKEYYKAIIDRINEFRLEKNLTIESLAYQSGIAKSGLSEILRYKKYPKSFTIAKICAALQIPLKEFYTSPKINEIIQKL